MVHKSLSLTLWQSFEHITLYTYNGAAIFFGGGGHPYIWSTTVLHNCSRVGGASIAGHMWLKLQYAFLVDLSECLNWHARQHIV